MATFTIKKGKTRATLFPRFVIGSTAIRNSVTFSKSCVHDLDGLNPGYLFGLRGYTRSIAFCWEYDANFDVIAISVEKFDDGETVRHPLGFVSIGSQVKLDILFSDNYAVLSICDDKRVLNSKFVPFDFLETGLLITPTFPVKAPHEIKIEMK